jgi:hypothetical protein
MPRAAEDLVAVLVVQNPSAGATEKGCCWRTMAFAGQAPPVIGRQRERVARFWQSVAVPCSCRLKHRSRASNHRNHVLITVFVCI